MSGILKGYSDWPGLERVCRIERVRITGEKREQELVYGITSLTRQRAGAKELLELSRAHWGIENRLHCPKAGRCAACGT